MIVKTETWTPAKAKKVLDIQEKRLDEGKFNNRHLDERTVLKYAQDMKAGHWLTTNQGIGFDKNGNLVDGRHRLWAVYRSGVTVKMVTAYGLEGIKNTNATLKPQDAIDVGRSRGLAQQLQVDGVDAPRLAAATARMIAAMALKTENRKISTAMAKGILNVYGETMRTIYTLSGRYTAHARGYLLAPWTLYYASHPSNCKQFSNSFYDLVGLPVGSPILALRKFLETHSVRGWRAGLDCSLATCNALMAYHNGDKLSTVRPSMEALDWLLKLQAENMTTVRKICGMNLAILPMPESEKVRLAREEREKEKAEIAKRKEKEESK